LNIAREFKGGSKFHGGDNLMALNTPMKIVLTVVIIILIGIGFYLLDYQKKLADIKQLKETLASKNETLKVNQERVKRLPEQLAKQEQLEKARNDLLAERLPQEDASIFVPKFIQSMEQLIAEERKATKDQAMQVVSITPGQLQAPGAEGGDKSAIKALEIFPKQPFQVNLTAKYPTVIHMLHQLAAVKLQRLVTIQKISLGPAESPKAGSPTLNVNMPMTAYLNEGKDNRKSAAPVKKP
jgi:Tfp pilus assembly protein PilO